MGFLLKLLDAIGESWCFHMLYVAVCYSMLQYVAVGESWYLHIFNWDRPASYGVATTSRILKIKGLFCKRAL